MMRRWLLLAILLGGAPALGQGTVTTDPVLDRLVEWIKTRVSELRLEGAPEPHRAVMALIDIEGYGARASFGELLYESPTRNRNRVRLQPANPALAPTYRPSCEIRGVVVGVYRKLR